MLSNDQTALLPRQGDPLADEALPRVDGWDVDRPTTVIRPVATGTAVVEGGVSGEHRALARLSWMLPTITMAVLGLVRVTWPSLSADELGRWAYAVLPWPQAEALLAALEPGAAPYQLALKGWADLAGTTDFVLRVPSVAAMTVAAGLVAALGTRLAGPQVGFLAGLIFAVLPVTSRYAQEIGPQALAICFAALATLALVRLFDRPRFWRYAAYFAAVVLLGLASPAALILLLAHGLTVLVMRRRVFFGWLAAVLLGLAPAAAGYYRWGAPEVRLDWTSPADLPAVTRLPASLFGLALLGGVLVGLGLLGLSGRKPGIVYTTWALVPVLALFSAAQLADVWRPEYLLFTVPAWALLGALALDRYPAMRGVLVAVVVVLLGLPTQLGLRGTDGHGRDSAKLAAVLATQTQPGDAVVYGPTDEAGQVGRDLLTRYLPADRRPKDALATRAPRTDGNLLAAECADVARCLANAPRVWLLRTDRPTGPLDGLPAPKDGPLRTRYTVDRSWSFTGLTLTRLVLKPAGAPGAGR